MNFTRFQNRTIAPKITEGEHTAVLTDIITEKDRNGRTIQKIVWSLTDLDNRQFIDVRKDTLAAGKTLTAFDNAVARLRDQLNLSSETVDFCALFTKLVTEKTPVKLYFTYNEEYQNFDVDFFPHTEVEPKTIAVATDEELPF